MVNINYRKDSITADLVPADPYIEGGCLHTDSKPTKCAVGSIMVESDTGDVYFYNGTAWVKQFSFQG